MYLNELHLFRATNSQKMPIDSLDQTPHYKLPNEQCRMQSEAQRYNISAVKCAPRTHCTVTPKDHVDVWEKTTKVVSMVYRLWLVSSTTKDAPPLEPKWEEQEEEKKSNSSDHSQITIELTGATNT